MKFIGVLGLLILLLGLLIMLVGFGGAVVNFAFPPVKPVCDMAERDYREAAKAVKDYEAAKGSSDEIAKEVEAKRALDKARASQDSCGRMKDTYRFYGMVFSGIGVVGFLMAVMGAIAAFVGLKRRKTLA